MNLVQDLARQIKASLPFAVLNEDPRNMFEKLVTYKSLSDIPPSIHIFNTTGNSTSDFIIKRENAPGGIGFAHPTLEIRAGKDVGEYNTLAFNTYAGGPLAKISTEVVAAGVYPNSIAKLHFAIQNGAGQQTMLTISENSTSEFFGNVGIGVSPSYKLHVVNEGLGLRVENTNTSFVGNAWQFLANDAATVDADASNYALAVFQTARPITSTGNIIRVVNSNLGEVFVVKDSGKVGIGTNDPKDILHVKIGSDLNWQFGYPSSSTTSLAALNDLENAYVLARIDANPLQINSQSGGGVAIGSTTPTNQNLLISENGGGNYPILEVMNTNTTASAKPMIRVGTGGDAVLELYRIGNAATTYINAAQAGNGNLAFQTEGNTKMVIANNGNVGIGTSNPTTNFVVSDNSASTSFEINPDDANNKVDLFAYDRGDTVYRDIQIDADTLYFRTINGNSTPLERMRITNAGYTLITNNTATAYTNVAPNISNFGLVIANNQNHVSGGVFSGLQFNQTGDSQNRITYIGAITEDVNQNSSLVFGTDSGGSGRTEKMRITSSGTLAVGTEAPSSQALLKADFAGDLLLSTGTTSTLYLQNTTNWVQLLSGDMRFGLSSAEKMRITSDGDFSIGGDATPSARLNVTDEYDGDNDIAYFENTHSTGGAFLTIKQYETNAQPMRAAGIRLGTKGNINWYQGILRRGGSDHYNTWSLNTSNDNNTVEAKLSVTTDGRVGINKTTADAAVGLHVVTTSFSGASGGILMEDGRADANPWIAVKNDAQQWQIQTAGARSDNFEIWDTTSAATRLAIDTSGNVGIGETSPSYSLQVNSPTATDANYIVAGDTSFVAVLGSQDSPGVGQEAFVGTLSNNDFKLKTNSTEKMRITSAGLIGMGTANPQGKLDVDGDLRVTHWIVSNTAHEMISLGSDRNIDDYGGLNKDYWRINLVTPGPTTTGESANHTYGDLRFSGVTGSNTTYEDRLTIRYNGNVGIGVTVPTARLHISDSNSTLLKLTRTSASNANWSFIHGDSGGNGHLWIQNTDTTKYLLSLRDDGHIGIGMTNLSAWQTGLEHVIQIGTPGAGCNAIFSDSSDNFRFCNNTYLTDGGWRYYKNGRASMYQQDGDGHIWYASNEIGVADDTIPWNENLRLYSDYLRLWNHVSETRAYGQAVTLTSGGQSWVKIGEFSNPCSGKIRFRIGTSNSEERGEVEFNLTYFAAAGHLILKHGTYSWMLKEVRVVQTSTGGAHSIWFNFRSDSNVHTATLYFEFSVHNITQSSNSFTISNTIQSSDPGTGVSYNNVYSSQSNGYLQDIITSGNILLQGQNSRSVHVRPSGASNASVYLDAPTGYWNYLLYSSAPTAGLQIYDQDHSEIRMVFSDDGWTSIGKPASTTGTANSSNFGTIISSLGEFFHSRDANGTSAVGQFYGNAGNFRIKGDGDLENTNNSYGAISDERLKSDIVDASSQLEDIKSVKIRKYTLDENGETHIGVVAQELEAAGMEGLVDTDEDGYKSVKYSVLYVKAVKALQEAIEKIETLETKVAVLEENSK